MLRRSRRVVAAVALTGPVSKLLQSLGSVGARTVRKSGAINR